MTNEEILQELSDIRAELDRLQSLIIAQPVPAPGPGSIIEKGDDILEGPNEFGAVKFRAVEKFKPGTWVLCPLTITKAAPLTDQQKYSIVMNCGYDEDTDSFVPAFGYFWPASQRTDNPAAKISSFCHESAFKKIVNLPFVKPRWTLDMQKGLANTIAVRTKDVNEIVAGLQAIRDGKN